MPVRRGGLLTLAVGAALLGCQQDDITRYRVPRIEAPRNRMLAAAARHKDNAYFLKTQFTNAELYQWMTQILSAVYRYFLQQATTTASLAQAQLAIIELLSRAAEFRDDETSSHTKRVGAASASLAKQAGAAPAEVELIGQAAPLHDIGKIGIPDLILLKPGALSEEERATMQKHTTIGNAILRHESSELMRLAAMIALSHHERWDGTGYPEGLAGEKIPLEARVVAISDVFDALTHNRPYRPAWKVGDALEEVRRNKGSHFDPHLVDVFLGQAASIES